jgi:subtilisin
MQMQCVFRGKTPVVLAFVLSLAAAGVLAAQAGRPDDRRAVIIGFKQRPGDGEEAFVRVMGGTVKRRFQVIPAMAARLPQPAIDFLKSSPAVTAIEPDVEIFALDEYSAAWGVSRIGSKVVHDAGNKGGSLKVCILDSGIDRTHPELSARYAGGYDFVNDDSDPADDNGHGTHVAGTIAATLNGTGVVGAAPEAQILAYKVLDSKGSGSFSDVIAALDACKNAGGRITNNSYGSAADPGTLTRQAFDNTYAAGLLHVAAAGNSGSGADKVDYPAKFDSVIAVAATDSSDARASFSSTGPAVELAAPGVNILSTYKGGQYAYASGTSMASPHVAGVAALVFNCGISTNAQVRARMQQTAQDLGAAGRDNLYGYGLVRADRAAMNCSSPPPQPPAAPSNLVAVSQAARTVGLTWQDNSSNETQFVLERCTVAKDGSCPYGLLATLPADTRSYSDASVARRTTYIYRVKARNSSGDSAYSVSNQITTK